VTAGLTFAAAVAPILFSIVVLVLVVLALWWLDRYEREPLGLVALAFLWGSVAGPLLSLAGEVPILGIMASHQGPFLSHMAGAILLAPFVEESAKGLGLLVLIALARNVDNPTDGMVYGAAVGLGFAASENLLYGLHAVASGGGHGLALMMLGRTVFSAGIHALATSIFGGALGAARLSPSWLRRFLLTWAGFAGAVVVHTGWNLAVARLRIFGPAGAHLGLVLGTVFLLEVSFVGVFLLATLMDHRVLLRELREEVELGVVPSWVAEVIPYYRRRIRGAWWPSRRERTVLCRLLTRLAFRKNALRNVVEDERHMAGLEVVHLRQRLREMLGSGDQGGRVHG